MIKHILTGLLITFCSLAYGQKLSYTTIIKTIEENSDFTFNYDPAETDRFTDFLDLKDFTETEIHKLFDNSPFEISSIENQILILPAEKKLYKFQGRVISYDELEPLPFSSLYTTSGVGVACDSAGHFELEAALYKNEHFIISYIGYTSKELSINDLTKKLNIYLKKDPLFVQNEIIVKGYFKKEINEGEHYGSIDIDLNLSKHGQGLIQQDVLRDIQKLPGIRSVDDSATNLSVRGSSSGQNGILWNGIPLYGKGHLFGMVSQINPYAIDRVSVYKSGFSAEYDDRVGGIIDMHSGLDKKGTRKGSIGVTLSEFHGFVQESLLDERLTLQLAGRYSVFPVFNTSPTIRSYARKVFNTINIFEEIETLEDLENDDVQIDYYDVNAALSYQLSENLSLSTSFIRAQDDFSHTNIFESSTLLTTENYNSSSSGYNVALQYARKNKLNTKISLMGSSYESAHETITSGQVTKDTTPASREIENAIIDRIFSISHEVLIVGETLNLGYSFSDKEVEYEYSESRPLEGEQETEQSQRARYHHLFSSWLWRKNNAQIDIGLRSSYIEANNNFRLAPKLGFRYKVRSDLRLRTSVGIYYQDIRQLFQRDQSSYNLDSDLWWLDGTSEAQGLRSIKYTLGAIYKNKGWLIDLDGYYHRLSGLSTQNPNALNQFFIDNNGVGYTRGVDVMVQKSFNRLSTTMYYELSENQISFPSLTDDDEEFFSANNDQRHNLALVNSYSHDWWSLDFTYQFRSGLPYSDPTGVEVEEGESAFSILYEGINNVRLQDYHRVDFGCTFLKNYNQLRFEAGIKILNIFDVDNELDRNAVLVNPRLDSPEPELLEISKRQLPRTLEARLRVYW